MEKEGVVQKASPFAFAAVLPSFYLQEVRERVRGRGRGGGGKGEEERKCFCVCLLSVGFGGLQGSHTVL